MKYASSSEMFCEIAKSYSVLSDAQTSLLLSQAAAGNQQAADKLLCHNLRIAIQAARDFHTPTALALEDLYQVAALGIRHAIEVFKPGMGCFFSHAYTWARYYILKEHAQGGHAVRQGIEFVKRSMHVRTVMADYYALYGCEPDMDELVRLSGYSENIISKLLSYGESSLDENFSESEDEFYNPLTDQLVSAYAADDALCGQDVERVLNGLLQGRNLDIIKSLYGIGTDEQKLSELAAKFQLSDTRIRQLRNEAMAVLRSHKQCFIAA